MAIRSKYKERVSRRGSRLHPALRPVPPWWLHGELGQLIVNGPFYEMKSRPSEKRDLTKRKYR